MKKIVCSTVSLVLISVLIAYAENTPPDSHRLKDNWDEASLWSTNTDGKSAMSISGAKGYFDGCLMIDYSLRTDDYGWVEMIRKAETGYSDENPVVFLIKGEASGDIEIKFVSKSGSVFGRKYSLAGLYSGWTRLVIYRNNTDYWWAGDGNFDGLGQFIIAFSGKGSGKLYIDEIGFGEPGTETSFSPSGAVYDPDRELKGAGFRQRRDIKLISEEPLVLEWLKTMQDRSSADKMLLPSMEENDAHTFNHALVSMAFILKKEKERAERILDFYANATVKNMWCPDLQNFYYRNEPRGFFQWVTLNRAGELPAYCQPGNVDRWMGDMAWLLIAYKYYEKEYSSKKYEEITGLLKGILISYFKETGPEEGYVQHGYRAGDKKLHEDHGHPEGNIDCYAAFKICGEDDYARKVKNWLDKNTKGHSLPLDLYTWRVLAYGKESAELLDIPDFDLRFRKTLDIKGKKVSGFYHGPDLNVNNIWLDGTGHIACAYFAVGNTERGNFFSNQLDSLIIDREIDGKKLKALPYTANNSGGYDWVNTDKGFISVAAWYIFSKNKFNPMTLEKF